MIDVTVCQESKGFRAHSWDAPNHTRNEEPRSRRLPDVEASILSLTQSRFFAQDEVFDFNRNLPKFVDDAGFFNRDVESLHGDEQFDEGLCIQFQHQETKVLQDMTDSDTKNTPSLSSCQSDNTYREDNGVREHFATSVCTGAGEVDIDFDTIFDENLLFNSLASTEDSRNYHSSIRSFVPENALIINQEPNAAIIDAPAQGLHQTSNIHVDQIDMAHFGGRRDSKTPYVAKRRISMPTSLASERDHTHSALCAERSENSHDQLHILMQHGAKHDLRKKESISVARKKLGVIKELKTNISITPNPAASISVRFGQLMQRSFATQKALQKWDKCMGLPRNHSPTMVNSNLSRKQLHEGKVLNTQSGVPITSTTQNQRNMHRRGTAPY